MEKEGLALAEWLDVVMLWGVVHCAGAVVGDVVAVEGDGITDEFSEGRAQIHEGDVDQDESGTVPQALEEDVAGDDERRPEHG